MNYLDFGFNSLMQKTLLVANNYVQNRVGSAYTNSMLNPATDIVFSSTDNDTAAWTEGTIYFSNGSESGYIDAGNTGNMTVATYIYFDRNKAEELSYSTEHSDAVGDSRFLVAIAEPGASGKKCKIIPLCGAGLIVSDITADQITAGAITSDLLTISGKSLVSTITWTATDYNTATWSAGTITMSDGTSYSIVTGNTGNIAALTYVYLDPSTSTTVLQTTTTAATSAGNNKRLIAIVQLGAVDAGCVIDVIGSNGTTIDGDRITTGKIQSSDGKTYFDLDGDVIIVNDGSNDIILFGYDAGGF